MDREDKELLIGIILGILIYIIVYFVMNKDFVSV